MHKVRDQFRPQEIAARALACGHFDADPARQFHTQCLIGSHQAFRGNVTEEVHCRCRFILCAVRQAIRLQAHTAVSGQAVRLNRESQNHAQHQ